MTEEDCESFGLWPIIVDVEGDAYSLWGPGGGEDDLLLADGDRLLAFRRWPDLVAFVADGERCNLASLEGYRALRQGLAQPGARVPERPKRYPLGALGGWLRDGSVAAVQARRATALDCLNLLWDAARTVGDADATRALGRDGGPLAALMDRLSFIVAEDDLADVEWDAAAEAYEALWGRLRRRWQVRDGAAG